MLFSPNKHICLILGTCSPIAPRRNIRVSVKMAASEGSINGTNRMLVFVPPHPLIKHWVSVLRNEQTPCPVFRNAIAELGRLLMYEASREWLPTVTGEIMSPLGPASVEFIDPREPIAVVPILRAGLALAEHASSVLPANKIYHIGISRNEETLLPSVYLNKLPDEFPKNSKVFLVDPMLATGGTLIAAMDSQITKAKEEAFSRKDILDRVEKWMLACEEESWLEDYNRDQNGYSASRGAYLNLKRAEKARILVSKIPAMVDTLVAKTRAWEEEHIMSFAYDGVPLLAMLDEYGMLNTLLVLIFFDLYYRL